ncbi:MAG: hypothetical protein LBP59_20115 [Planctomycetaceae bacterium]|jgi:hypothetical protein|nr:hypothetical protein [Planctomycetaceae bacterium]
MKKMINRKLVLIVISLLCFAHVIDYGKCANANTSELNVNGKNYKLSVQPDVVPAAPSFIAPSVNYNSPIKAENQSKVSFIIVLMDENGKFIEELPAEIEKVVYKLEVELGSYILKVSPEFVINANQHSAQKQQTNGKIITSVGSMLAFDLPNLKDDTYENTLTVEVYFKGITQPLKSYTKISVTCVTLHFTVNVNRGDMEKNNYQLTILDFNELLLTLGPPSIGSAGFAVSHASWKVTADERFCAINTPGYEEQHYNTVNGKLIGFIPGTNQLYSLNMSSYLKTGKVENLSVKGLANTNEIAEVQHGFPLDTATVITEMQYTKTNKALAFTRNFLSLNTAPFNQMETYNLIESNCADMAIRSMKAAELNPPGCKTKVVIYTLDSNNESVTRKFELSLPDTLMDLLQGIKKPTGPYGYKEM